MTYDYDLFIIGAGPAGLAAAKRATKYGVRVAIAEQEHLGGCCVNRGCVPKKLMVYAADFAAQLQEAADYGWGKIASQFDWQQFRAARDQHLQQLRQNQEASLKQAGIDLVKGQAHFLDPHQVEVGGRSYTAQHILIAVGGKPTFPKIPGIEHTLTSRDLLNLEQLPQRIAIIGGGYIGVEFASILCGFGCEVTLMNRESCILEGFDQDVQTAVRQGLEQRGIKSLCSTTTDQIAQTSNGLCLNLTGDCPDKLLTDTVLCATGRAPNVEGLGLESAEVEVSKKAITVDQQSRTNQSHIFAVGDCTSRMQLTPVAKAEGQAVVDYLYGNTSRQVNYNLVPTAVVSRPEAAMVGMTEAQAREQFKDAVSIYRKEFQALRYSLTNRQSKSLLKLVVNNQNDQILGVHMVGDDAAEIVQNLAVALQKGVTKPELERTIGIHPSAAEELFTEFT